MHVCTFLERSASFLSCPLLLASLRSLKLNWNELDRNRRSWPSLSGGSRSTGAQTTGRPRDRRACSLTIEYSKTVSVAQTSVCAPTISADSTCERVLASLSARVAPHLCGVRRPGAALCCPGPPGLLFDNRIRFWVGAKHVVPGANPWRDVANPPLWPPPLRSSVSSWLCGLRNFYSTHQPGRAPI